MYTSIISTVDAALSSRIHVRETPVEQGPTRRADFAPFFLWALTAAALIDWLITRTATRFAIFLPKTPAMITAYQALTWVGQLGSALAALLALAGLLWVVGVEWKAQRFPVLAALLAGLGGLSVLFLFLPSGNWLFFYHLLAVGAVGFLVWRSLRMKARPAVRLAVLLPAVVLALTSLHMAAPTLYGVLRWSGPPLWSGPIFLVGEALIVISAWVLWWTFGRNAGGRVWLFAGAAALFFVALFLAAPALTASVVVWSTGLTLFLPWPCYAAALCLWGVVVGATWRRLPVATCALLLLAAAGYTPQLSSQLFFGLMAIWLLTQLQAREIVD